MSTATPVKPPTSTGRRYATTAVAAKYLAVNVNTIRRMIKEGTLTEYRSGNRLVRVDLNEIDLVMQARGEIMIECDDPACKTQAAVVVPPGWVVVDGLTFCADHHDQSPPRLHLEPSEAIR